MPLKEKTGLDFLFENGYRYDRELRIWERPGRAPFGYSDGDQIEEDIYRAVREARDISTASDELAGEISNWPSEYHLSKSRHNLLRPFNFGEEERVLELGAGCGAITRQLGEEGALVFALEGARRRAAIAAERCRDLPNVAVIRDDIAGFYSREKFSLVTLIGVLEYARKFLPGKDPVRKCLKIAANHLTEDGVLILAMENQLGLKYLNGALEDHLSFPFWGINDLYASDSPVTFGRGEISWLLRAAGFGRLEFFYPFPDYKLPRAIVSERGLARRDFNIGDLLARVEARDYNGTAPRSFNENLAWHVAARNGLVGQLANSFLIFASKGDGRPAATWLAKTYSAGRKSAFAVEASFEAERDGIVVRKKKISDREQVDSRILHIVHDEPYIEGDLYLTGLYRIVARGGGPSEIAEWARPWVEFLTEHAISHGTSPGAYLPGNFIDCVPFNLIRDKDGRLVYFDDEWRSIEPVPLHWVVVRGLAYALDLCPKCFRKPMRELLDEIFPLLSLRLSDFDYGQIALLEDRLLAFCNESYRGSFLEGLVLPPGKYYLQAESHLSALLQEKDKEIGELARTRDGLLNSLSWRLTAPLRWVKDRLFPE